MRNPPLVVAALGAIALLAAAAWSPLSSSPVVQPDEGKDSAKDRVEVKIADLSFLPEEVKIRVGQTVRWTNKDDRDHSILAKDQSFKSGNLRPKETFDHKFDAAGTFEYFSVMHPRTRGSVVVEEKK